MHQLVAFLATLAAASANSQDVGASPETRSSTNAPPNYEARIFSKVSSRLYLPSETPADAEVVIDLQLLPNGSILELEQVRSSGYRPYEKAVVRAIEMSEPLPVPSDLETFKKYRYLRLVFRPASPDTKKKNEPSNHAP